MSITTRTQTCPDAPAEPDDQAPSALQIVALIAAREISTRLRDKAFLISTGVLLAIVALTVAVPLFLQRGSDRPEFTVAVVGPQATAAAGQARILGHQAIVLADRLKDEKDSGSLYEPGPALRSGESAAPPAKLTLKPVADAAAAEKLVQDRTAEGALVSDPSGRITVIGKKDVDDDLARLLTIATTDQTIGSALQNAGLDATQSARLTSVQPPQVRLLDPPSSNSDIATGLGIAFSVLFFLTAFTYGLLIAQSVVEEKQSRVVELLVAAVPARLILVGKVLGTSSLALGQVVLLLAVGGAAAAAAGQSAAVSLLLHSGGWFVLFFVVGFTMLSCLWAATGAVCARQEDLQSATAPMQFLLMGPFFASMYVTTTGPWMTVLSYFPLSAPLSMPRRLLLGDAAWWELLLSTAGIVLTGALVVLIATRLYENSLLRTASKTSFRAAWAGTTSGVPVATAGSDPA